MIPLRRRSPIVERFVLCQADHPPLSIEAFAEERGRLDAGERLAIEAYLRTESMLATLRERGTEGKAPPADGHHPLIGKEIGPYVLEAVLGRGGSGTVFRSRERSLDRAVALKILHPAWAADPERLERFRREGAALARLRHPQIVPVHAAGEDEGVAYLVMPLLEGGSLEALIADRRARGRGAAPPGTDPDLRSPARWLATVDGAVGVAAGLADALDHAHGMGIIHRDVKPGNVLLDRDGHPYLVDFGLARDALHDRLTESGEVVGTPLYMAPEQVDPSFGPVDARTDVFSLGVTLFELLTSVHPFLAGPGAAPSVRRLRRQIPRDVETVVRKAMDPDPRRRYASAGAFRDDLRRILSDEPVRARGAGPVRRFLSLSRRRPARTAAVALGTLVLATVVAWQLDAAASRRRDGEQKVADARTCLSRSDPRLALSLLDRARALGTDEPELRAEAEASLRRAETVAALDEARSIVFDRDAGATEIARARQLCQSLDPGLSDRDAIDRALISALLAFRMRDVLGAAAFALDAAKRIGIHVDAKLIAECQVLAFRILRTARGGNVVRSVSYLTAIDGGDRDLSARLLGLLKSRCADLPEANVALGLLLYSVGQKQEAIDLLDSALDRDPTLYLASFIKAHGHAELGRIEAARETANAAVVAGKDRPGPWYLRGAILSRAGLHEAALRDFDRALGIHPGFANAVLLRASSLSKLGRSSEAEVEYGRAVALMPESAFVRFVRSQFFHGHGRRAEALADLDLALGEPEVPAARIQEARAAVLTQLGRHEEAVRAADLSIAADPTAARPYAVKAEAEFELGRLAAAVHNARTAARIARRIPPEDGPERYAEAARSMEAAAPEAVVVPEAAGDDAEAVSRLRRRIEDGNPLLRFDDEDLTRRLELACVLAGGGDEREAVRCLLATCEDAKAYAASPPPALPAQGLRESLRRSFGRALRLLEQESRFDGLQDLAGFERVLVAWGEALASWQ